LVPLLLVSVACCREVVLLKCTLAGVREGSDWHSAELVSQNVVLQRFVCCGEVVLLKRTLAGVKEGHDWHSSRSVSHDVMLRLLCAAERWCC
jgi:hypothetical protein